MTDHELENKEPVGVADVPTASTIGAPVDDARDAPSPFDALYEGMRRDREKEAQLYDRIVGEPQYVEVLKKAFDSYSSPLELHVGDLIQWKPLMQNRRYPNYGAPAVLVRRLPTPVDKDDEGDSLPELEDIVVGWVTGDRTFALFTTSSARFEKWDG